MRSLCRNGRNTTGLRTILSLFQFEMGPPLFMLVAYQSSTWTTGKSGPIKKRTVLYFHWITTKKNKRATSPSKKKKNKINSEQGFQGRRDQCFKIGKLLVWRAFEELTQNYVQVKLQPVISSGRFYVKLNFDQKRCLPRPPFRSRPTLRITRRPSAAASAISSR
jgi:hypothetical protein